jgi:protein O-mannosyl-transferase
VARAFRRVDALLLSGILLATLAVYARALAGELVYDDLLLIGRNPLIADLGNLPKLFTSGYWDFLDVREAQYIGYWRPLTAVVQALLWPVAGAAPLPYHAASLAFHLGAVAAAYALILRLGAGTWLAAAGALLFAMHPAHVESVAWISALNDPLFGCLALLALERFLAWRARGSGGLPMAALACFAFALLAKELAAALVPMLFVVDLLRPSGAGEPEARLSAPAGLPRPLRAGLEAMRLPYRAARAYAPFGALFALYLGARMLVFASPWAGFDRITTDFLVSASRLALLRLELFGGALEILTVPLELSLFRPFRPHIELTDPALLRAAVFSALFAALLVATFLGRRRLALAALLVIPAGLLPILIRTESLGVFPLSERFLYLPAFGFALGAALFLAQGLPRRAATAAVLVLAGLYAARSHARIGDWRDEETLFRASAAQSPRSIYVQWGLGRVLLERVNAGAGPEYLAEAQRVFERAAELLLEAKRPDTDLMATSRDFLQVNLGLAWCSIYADDWSAAIVALESLAERIEALQAGEREALAAGMRVREQFLDLEKVYTALGVAQFKSGQLEAAERSYLRALELQPSSPETQQNLGRMRAAQGRWEEAVHAFEGCARMRPGNTEDRLLLAQALQTLGQRERAEELARALVRELPDRPEPLLVLATGALNRQDPGGALEWLERALALEPRNSIAWYQKARALLLRGDARGAMSAFRNAVEIDPTNFEAHHDCASFLLSQGALAEARPYLVRAYTLSPPPYRAALRQSLQQLEFTEAAPLLELSGADAKRGELGPALEWLDRVRKLEPDRPAHELARARLLRRMGRDFEGAAALRACADRALADFELWAELALYLQTLGSLDEARKAATHALTLSPPAAMPPELQESTRARLLKLATTPADGG